MYEAVASVDGPADGRNFVMFGVAVPAAGFVDGVPWSGLPASGLLLDVLAGLDSGSLGADQALDAVQALERVVALAQGVQAELLARFAAMRRGGGGVGECAADEVAPLVKVSRQHAAGRIALACDLSARFPETLAALRAGEMDVVKARVLSELTLPLPDAQARLVQARVLPKAGAQTPAQFRATVRRAVLEVDPGGSGRRERLARQGRRVLVTALDDGMAELWALLPAPEAVAARDRIDRLARGLPADDARSMDQRRADCLVDLLLGTTPRQVTAQIHLTVPASALTGPPGAGHPADPGHPADAGHRRRVAGSSRARLPERPSGGAERPSGGAERPAGTVPDSDTTPAGTDSEPAHLAGYGPITPTTARELAAGALGGDTTWRRILTDPVNGSVLDVGRDTYRPPAALADHVRTRDKYCRFPGCRVPADRCDLDHTIPYDNGGSTASGNLGALCRHHHRLKHQAGWRLTQDQPGRFTWTSPTGRSYTTEPEPEPP